MSFVHRFLKQHHRIENKKQTLQAVEWAEVPSRTNIRGEALRWCLLMLVALGFVAMSGCLQKVPRACRNADDCTATAPAIFCYEGFCSEQQCKPGAQEVCYEGPKGTDNQGRCKSGYRSCLENGRWTPCLGQILPRPEFCDKTDNNCDGKVDNVAGESCRCAPQGRKRACYNGKDDTQGTGACRGGVQYCERDNLWGRCLGNVEPEGELCNGFDDDCNGKIDDHPSCTCKDGERRSCYQGDPAVQNVGRCKAGVQICSNQQWGPCTGMVLPRPEGEDCSTPGDDNCNGQDNEGCEGNACKAGEAKCGDSCVTLASDSKHCGACNNACSRQQLCEQGVCACPSGLQMCGAGQDCVDLKKSPLHCGACNKACANGESCCGGQCANTQIDVKHCGGCSNVCAADERCDAGVCKPDCATGQTLCQRACVDLNTDVLHCGQCSKACRSGEVCNQGTCACTQGFTSCSTGCVDTKNDKAHCGGCGKACPDKQFCRNGACVCPTGLTLCNGQCVDLQTQVAHCGACGNVCGSGKYCGQGTCKDCTLGSVSCGSSCCPNHLKCCNGQCVDPSTHPVFCGDCQTVCTSTQVCQRSGTTATCICREGVVISSYSGPTGTVNVGRCRPAIQVCERGVLVSKQQEVLPLANELCNNLDDNCNGQKDEEKSLEPAPACPKTLGVCAGTIARKCNGAQGWEPCTTAMYTKHNSEYEVRESKCDGLDNDCDGAVDEEQDLGRLKPCTSQDGVCKGKFQRCSAGKWLDCNTPLFQAADFSCDGLDNDCDGSVDEDGSCGCLPTAVQTPYTRHGNSNVRDVAFRPTGGQAASVSGTELRVWRVSDRRTLQVIALPRNNISRRLVWSPDGLWIAVTTGSDYEGVWIFNPNSGKLVRRLSYRGRTGANNSQLAAVFSPDGKTLLTGIGASGIPGSAVDHPIVQWDYMTGKVLQTFKGHSNGVLSLAISPDGSRLVSSGYDKKVHIWNVKTQTIEQTLTGASDTVWSVDWSRRGNFIAGGVNNGDVVLWKNTSGSTWSSTIWGLAHVQAVGRVRFRPNSKILATSTKGSPIAITANTGFDDRAIRLWDVSSNELLRTMYGHAAIIEGMSWSPDGRWLSSVSKRKSNIAGSGDIRLWGCPTSCKIQNPTSSGGKTTTISLKHSNCHAKEITGLAFDKDGSKLASISQDGKVCVWSMETNKLLHSDSLPAFVVPQSVTFQAINFDSQDLMLVVGGDDNKHYVWSTNYTRGNPFEELKPSVKLGFRPSRYELLATAGGEDLALWNVRNMKRISSTPGTKQKAHPGGIRTLQWSPSGSKIATAGADGQLRFWEVTLPPKFSLQLQARQQASVTGSPNLIDWHPSEQLVVVGPTSGGVESLVLEASTPNPSNPVSKVSHGNTLTGTLFSLDGKYLYTVGKDRQFKVYDVSSSSSGWQLKFNDSFSLGSQTPVLMAQSPKGGVLAIANSDRSIVLYQCTP